MKRNIHALLTEWENKIRVPNLTSNVACGDFLKDGSVDQIVNNLGVDSGSDNQSPDDEMSKIA